MMYTSELGTLSATHFRKYCQNSRKGCQYVQYYGFHTVQGGVQAYDSDWSDLPYFVSTHKTAFETKILVTFNGELLIGQISYKQRSDIYNYIHFYENLQKTISQGHDHRQHESDDEEDEDRYVEVALRQLVHRY